ncbi:protein kinase [Streptomyces sp. NPDC041068]|uniref:protein kinase domain-containing protein n=1 Tax=Streptomyces sp. NPDC041068 TaxID=3155130 RepID=UPI0033F6777C
MNSAGHFIGPDAAPDRYRLLNSIGRGGEAVLYRAELQLDGAPETVVVKILDSSDAPLTPDQFERLSAKWNEQAELLRFVGRPGVVGVREHFEGPPIHPPGQAAATPGRRALVLVMNHVDGLSLRDWRDERTLTTHRERREVGNALEQLADVLDWLHSGHATPSGRPVVHGDLSPGNVMVDAHGQATLVDFGLSKLSADHSTSDIWFTPGYAAPEVFEGRRTPNTDRYAFGAIAYYLLSRQQPPSTPEQLRAALGALPQVSSLSQDRRQRVLAACATEPGQRPESLRAWVRDIRDVVVSTTGPEPVPPGLPVPPPLAPPATPPVTPTPPKPAVEPTPDVTTWSAPLKPPPAAPPTPAPAPAPTPCPAPAHAPASTPPKATPTPAPAPPEARGPEPEDAVPKRFVPEGPRVTPLFTPPRRRRRVLVPALVVIIAALLGVVGVQALTGDDSAEAKKPEVTAEPTETEPTPSESEEDPSADEEDPSAEESASESADPGDVAAADTASLTGFSSVDGDDTIEVKAAPVDSIEYDDALVADSGCGGYVEYNLDRAWSKLDLVAGVDDNSAQYSARLDIKVDGKALHGGKVSLGEPKKLSLDVKNGLRLSISYNDPADDCSMGTLVLGDPTLKK